MELQFPYLLLSLLIPLLIWVLLGRQNAPKYPPGPPQLPVLGHMHLMSQLTHRGLAKLAAAHGGLMLLKLGFSRTAVVSTAAMAKQILQTHDHIFAGRPATATIRYLTYDRSDMAFAHYGPFWRQIRKLSVVKLFSRRRAHSWSCVATEVNAATHQILDTPRGQPVNLGEIAFNFAKNVTYGAAFGASVGNGEEQEEFMGIMQEFSRLFGAFNLADFLPWLERFDLQGINKRMVRARSALDRFIDRIIDDHLEKGRDGDDQNGDMVDDMLAFLDEGGDGSGKKSKGGDTADLGGSFKLNRNHIKAIIMDVMFGGTETVASAIEWTMAELLKNPKELTKLREELTRVVGVDRKVNEEDLDKLPYLKACIKETLRLHPPIPLLMHEAMQDADVAGYRVPAGTQVLINAWAIGRAEDTWQKGEEFLPGRFVEGPEAVRDFNGGWFELVPFGSGRRSCPGMKLGLYGLEWAVAQMVHCFDWELPGGMKAEDLDMEDVAGLTAPRANRLCAVPKPRLACPI